MAEKPPTVPIKRIETGDGWKRGERVELWIIDCPFCGREHSHGASPGHRVSHCVEKDNPGYVLARPTASTRRA